MGNRLRKKEAYLAWRKMDGGERIKHNLPLTETAMSDHLLVSTATFHKWNQEEATLILQSERDKEYQEFIQENTKSDLVAEVKENLRKLSKNNAFAAKILLQLEGVLVEKQETKLIIDGNFIAGAILKAERELGESGYGIPEVQEELSLLPPELREDTGQSQAKDN